MRRRTLFVALARLAVLAVGAVAVWSRPEWITPKNYARIRLGMSRAEVYTFLGPPGGYSTRDAKASDPPNPLRLTDLRPALSLSVEPAASAGRVVADLLPTL
jgi:hypothetical protein